MQVLDPLPDLDVLDGTKVSEVARLAAEHLGWRPAGKLLRLEGFKGPWDRCLLAGKLLEADAELVAAGVKEGDVVTYVLVELVAEGWKVGCFWQCLGEQHAAMQAFWVYE